MYIYIYQQIYTYIHAYIHTYTPSLYKQHIASLIILSCYPDNVVAVVRLLLFLLSYFHSSFQFFKSHMVPFVQSIECTAEAVLIDG